MEEIEPTGAAQRLAALYAVSTHLDSTLTLEERLEAIVDAAVGLTGAARGCFVLGDTSEDRLAIVAARDAAAQPVSPADLEGSTALARQVLSDGEPRLVDAACGDEQRVALCLPLRAGDRIAGALYVDRRAAAGPFSADDRALLAALAAQAAAAVENARLHEAAQAARDARSEYVSLITHELRIPMTSIRGYTDILLREMAGPLNDEQRRFLQTVRRNLDRMATLIRDLSDINRVESGRMQLASAPFDVRDVVSDVLATWRDAAAAQAQRLTAVLPSAPLIVYGDRPRLTQVLDNLVNNAHKYTPDGGHIEVRLAQSEDGMVRVEVADDGLGITAAEQAQLFTPFFRGESAAVREQSGWGLGLTVVKRMVELQGGVVACTSEPGAGSTFSFTVPAGEGSEA